MSFKKKLLPLAVAQVVATSAFTVFSVAPAMAQQATGDSQQPIRVEVTGSNVRRADAETPSPVQVITGEDLKKSGYTSVSDALKNITANGQGTLSGSNSEAFAGGGNGVALRGLTVGATLVLIDGHRMAPYPLSDDGERQFVDITAIPFDAVDRIEVLKDGASAVYGSDAIAGVVNVILKKSYTGTSVTAEVGATQQGGGGTDHFSILHGFGDLDADGIAGYFNIEYRQQNSIKADQRPGQPFTNQNWTGQGGNDLNPGAVNQFTPTPSTKNPYLINAANNSMAFYPGPCNATNFATPGGCDFANTWSELVTPSRNVNVLASVTKKLAGDWELNFKASIFESTGEQVLQAINPIYGSANTFPGSSFGGYTAINGNGSSLPPAFQVGLVPSFTVPTNYPGNTTGGPAYVYGMIPGLAPESQQYDSKSYRLVADLNGTWGDWDLKASLGFTRVATDVTYNNFVNYSALYAALNAPNGSPNQFLLTGNNSPAVMRTIAPQFGAQDTDELDFLELHGTRELFKLSGGSLGMATGFEFVHKSLNAPLATPVDNGTVGGTFNPYVFGQQNDAAAYIEFVAPVLKSLEIDADARVDHYDTYGNSFTPKLSAKWTPIDAVAFRGSLSKGFRAPTSAENGNAGLTFGLGQTIQDPLLCPNGPTAKGAAVNQCGVQLGYLQLTNPALQPEKSNSVTLGTILEPVKGWSTTIDYYNIVIKNQIVTNAELAGFQPTYIRGVPTSQPISDGAGGTTIGTPAYGNILLADSTYVNANSTRTSGIELTSRYKFKLGEGLGSFTPSIDYSHMFKYELTSGGITYQLAGTHGPSGISGDTGNPRDRAQLSLAYDNGGLNVTTNLNWTGDYSIIDPSGSENFHQCQSSLTTSTLNFAGFSSGPSQYCEVKSFLDTDLNVTYKVNKSWTVKGSVTNLFNQAAPIDMQTYAGSFLPYNPSLDIQGLIGRSYNLGAVYKF